MTELRMVLDRWSGYRFAMAYKQGGEKTPTTVIFKERDGARLHKLEGAYYTHFRGDWLLAEEGVGREGMIVSASDALGASPGDQHGRRRLVAYERDGEAWRRLPIDLSHLTSWAPQEIFLYPDGRVLCVSPREQTATVYRLSRPSAGSIEDCFSFTASLREDIPDIGNSEVLFLTDDWLCLSTPSSDTSGGSGAADEARISMWRIRVDEDIKSVSASRALPPTAYIALEGDSPISGEMKGLDGHFAFRSSEDGGRLRVYKCEWNWSRHRIGEVLSGLDLGARCRPRVDFCLTDEGVVRARAAADPSQGGEGETARFEIVPYKKKEEVSWKDIK